MNPILLVQLTLVHFISDFLLQNDWMAHNKSKNSNALFLHSTIYGLPFLVFGNIGFVAYLIVTHFCIDGITSRITSRIFKKWYFYMNDLKMILKDGMPVEQPSLHYFFVVIGFDQWLHFLILLAGCFLYNTVG